jgi:hypothetical protein
MNFTRMHVFTHVRESMLGRSGMPGNEYAEGMLEHDEDVGKLLDLLDELKIDRLGAFNELVPGSQGAGRAAHWNIRQR